MYIHMCAALDQQGVYTYVRGQICPDARHRLEPRCARAKRGDLAQGVHSLDHRVKS